MSNNNNSSSNKKAKMEDFAAVRAYLEQSPFGADHPAVQAAIAGLEAEQQRQARDSKLQRKFASASSERSSNNNSTMISAVESEDADAVKVERPIEEETKKGGSNSSSPMEEEEWQNIEENEQEAAGSALAKQAVTALSDNSVHCSSANAALAAVLHAALLQTGFSCTGVPESTTSASNGFAAPIRNLKEFLPHNWDTNASCIQLRYRKPDTGAIVLTVASNATNEVRVTLAPTTNSNKDEEPNVLQLQLSDHVNLESWARASNNGTKRVSPTLHFKSLATLLQRFSQQFDLGNSHTTDHRQHYVDYTMLGQRQAALSNNSNNNNNVTAPSNNSQFHPNNPARCVVPPGDFVGDLTPTGIYQMPGGFDGMPTAPGNLMGPNHPMFSGRAGPAGSSNPFGGMNTGVGTMHPRFDPFGPPNGPTEPGGGVDPDGILQNDPLMRPKRGPPGGTGVPNKDLAQPPTLPNNNMFM